MFGVLYVPDMEACVRDVCLHACNATYQDGALFRYASGELLEIAAERFTIRDMSRITHAFARAGVWDEPVFRYTARALWSTSPSNACHAMPAPAHRCWR
jgi:hypothetical protein